MRHTRASIAAAAGDGGGSPDQIAEYASVADLIGAVPMPADGAAAIVRGVKFTAKDDYWAPWWLDRSDLARVPSLEWSQADALADVVARAGWTVGAGVSKEVGGRLTLNGSGTSPIALLAASPGTRGVIRFWGVLSTGTGTGGTAQPWMYRGDGLCLDEVLLGNAASPAVQFRNSSNGSLKGRPMAARMDGEGEIWIGWDSRTVTSPGHIWSPDDVGPWDGAGTTRIRSDYASGLSALRVYYSTAGVTAWGAYRCAVWAGV
jgi:hypothetical protein